MKRKEIIINAICEMSDDYDEDTLSKLEYIELLEIKINLEKEKQQDHTFSSRITAIM
jgi:hypothetical protein